MFVSAKIYGSEKPSPNPIALPRPKGKNNAMSDIGLRRQL